MKKRRNWKAFYQRERAAMKEETIRRAAQHPMRSRRIDRLATVVAGGGTLSFPHTFLRDNLANYLDICAALCVSGKTNLVFIGVLHSNDERDIAKEFSLDNFEHVLRVYARTHRLATISVRKKVFPLPAPRDIGSEKWDNYLCYLGVMKEDVRAICDSGTALLMTGDPCHYGHGYAAFHREPRHIEEHPQRILKTRIAFALATLFKEGRYGSFAEQSRELLSDQTSAAILVKQLLGPKTAHEVYSLKFSDYSGVTASPAPTLVASVFYGVFPE